MNNAVGSAPVGAQSSESGTTSAITPDLVRALHEDGAVLIKNALSADEMAVVKDVFEFQLANIARWSVDQRTANSRFVIDAINPDVWDAPFYQRLWKETPLVDIAGQIFSTPEVWLWYSQVFFKQASAGETVSRTHWHQDLMYDSLAGDDLLRLWISLEPLEKGYSLEFVRGSHRAHPIYNVGVYDEAAALTANNGEPMPPLPDIEADRSQWDIISWAMEPGDVIAFHPGALHGGGPTKPNGTRRTLTMMFFGRDARYSTRPVPSVEVGAAEIDAPDRIMRQKFAGVQPGEPAWRSTAPRLK